MRLSQILRQPNGTETLEDPKADRMASISNALPIPSIKGRERETT
jgi:hypothetical protein